MYFGGPANKISCIVYRKLEKIIKNDFKNRQNENQPIKEGKKNKNKIKKK